MHEEEISEYGLRKIYWVTENRASPKSRSIQEKLFIVIDSADFFERSSMKLSNHDINQIDDAYTISLSQIDAHKLFRSLRDDLIEALDRLNQNSSNSSRPPSSREPWFSSKTADEIEETDEGELIPKSELGDLADDSQKDLKNENTAPFEKFPKSPKREVGKQKGAQ